MERLSIDEIIAHCERNVQSNEKHIGREHYETEDMDSWYMKEYWEHRQVAEYLKELKAYRDAEEQGLLLRLPCKVGDTVWLANKLFSSEVKCLTIRWIEIVKGLGFHAELENGSGLLFYDYEIGKRVFLTKEEAEQKLESMQKGE